MAQRVYQSDLANLRFADLKHASDPHLHLVRMRRFPKTVIKHGADFKLTVYFFRPPYNNKVFLIAFLTYS
jgi:hypothetical protein